MANRQETGSKDLNPASPLSKLAASPGTNWNRKIKFRDVARLTVSFPLAGFIFGVLYAVYIDAEKASRTDCGAKNYLPSVSAATGGFPLSELFWKFCIGIHALPRYGVAVMYYRYLKSIISLRKYLIKITCVLYLIEITFLLALTAVSSFDNFALHQKFFGIFMLSSTLYMSMMTLMLFKHRNSKIVSKLEEKSRNAKRLLLNIFLTSGLLAFMFFARHRTHCENGVYTVFSFCEYIAILSNVGFHMTAYWDFYDEIITIPFPKIKLNVD